MPYAEIVRGSAFGEALFGVARRPDVKIVVEIGTWSGMGSTKCLIDGLIDSGKKDAKLFTFECLPERHAEAVVNLSQYQNSFGELSIINGSVLSPEEFPTFDPSLMVKEWYDIDIGATMKCGCKSDLIPESVDFLLIDGGAFTGWNEFLKLFCRTRIFALDDTRYYKTSRIREFLINSKDFKVVSDNLNDRNGFAIFERI